VRVSHARCEGLSIPVHVDVKNVGERDGAHTVLVYASPPAAAAAPRRACSAAGGVREGARACRWRGPRQDGLGRLQRPQRR
jgi:hypothetical protein